MYPLLEKASWGWKLQLFSHPGWTRDTTRGQAAIEVTGHLMFGEHSAPQFCLAGWYFLLTRLGTQSNAHIRPRLLVYSVVDHDSNPDTSFIGWPPSRQGLGRQEGPGQSGEQVGHCPRMSQAESRQKLSRLPSKP